MANKLVATVKNWFGKYFPRFYIPANKRKDPTIEEYKEALKRQALLQCALLEGLTMQRGQYESLKDESVAIISALVMANGGDVVVNKDIVDAIYTHHMNLSINTEGDGSLTFKLEEIVQQTPPEEVKP